MTQGTGIAGAQDYVVKKLGSWNGCYKCGAKLYRDCADVDACPHVTQVQRRAILEMRPDLAREGELDEPDL